MKLHATIKNERGGKKSTSDNTRILVELSYKNKVVGEVGLYRVWDKDKDLGYRVVWKDGTGRNEVIREEEKVKKQKGEDDDCCKECGSPHKDGYETLCYDCQMKS